MGEIKNYRADIISNTHEILTTQYDSFESKGREYTFLVNCLLGIIVAISENENSGISNNFNNNIDHEFLNIIPEKIRFIDDKSIKRTFIGKTDLNSEITITVEMNERCDLLRRSKKWLLGKLRNSIAHQNIESINQDEEWIGVRLYNKTNYWVDFEIEFTKEELKNFCIELAEMNNQ